MYTPTHTGWLPFQAMFLNLLFKSVKSDPEINRVKAFLKRILQICSAHSPPFICGCLFLISEVSFLGMTATCILYYVLLQNYSEVVFCMYCMVHDYYLCA